MRVKHLVLMATVLALSSLSITACKKKVIQMLYKRVLRLMKVRRHYQKKHLQMLMTLVPSLIKRRYLRIK